MKKKAIGRRKRINGREGVRGEGVTVNVYYV